MEQKDYQNLINSLKSAIGLLNLTQTSQLHKDVLSICNHLENPNFRIAVFGPFNYGKSTLLNAILGDRALPIDLIPTTGAAIKVKYGKELQTHITLTDGSEISESGTEVLKRFAILNDARQMRSDVASIEVSCPHDLLANGVELLDLPGTNDREAQDKLVRDQLLTADLVIQVLDGRKLMTLGERENLRDWLLDRGIKTVIFVVNFLNLLEPEDQKEVYNRLRFVAESFRAEFPAGISNLYRVDALPALRSRLKGDVSAAHSTGLVMFESALQNLVAMQKENLAARLPRVQAIATQVQQALQCQTQIIATEIAASQQKRTQKIQIKQQAEKLLKQGFQSSLSNFQGFLYLPKLLERYQSELACALQQDEFTSWEGKFKPVVLEYQQAIVKWIQQACEFFEREQPDPLIITYPEKPDVFLPSQPPPVNQPSASTGGIVSDLSRFLIDTIGTVVIEGTNYLFGEEKDEEKSEERAAYLEQISQAYTEAAEDYLLRFNTQAVSTLRQYEEIAEKAIIFSDDTEPLESHQQHHLKLLNNLLDNLNQELESVIPF